MAGNKINPKTKGKDERMKGCKGVTQTSEDSEDIDFAVLRKPVPTSITGFAQARKIFDLATEELKDLLSNECDVLYECKVCRNIFRSLANFISHKRVYCKEKFNTSLHGHFVKNASAINEYLEIKRTEEGYQKSLKANNSVSNEDDNEDRVPLTKDITAIYEKLTKCKGHLENQHEPQQVVLKKISGSSVAVFQNTSNDESSSDNMRIQIKELDNILSRDQAVLQNDGKFIIKSSKDCETSTDLDNVIQISDDDEIENYDELKCKICDLQFSTQKTLKFHMKYKHVESRLVYPCPDCLEIFSTSWSVYRHLFKVHRKTAAQIRRLRESIQSKAFKINNPPAFYEKRKNNLKVAAAQKITEEERIDQENQAWMDNMECDGEVPRCGGCGRSFPRRAALAAHTHTCQPRSRALARRPEGKKIEIQIRKDYNKGPVTGLTILKPDNYDAKVAAAEAQAKKDTQENETMAETEDKVSEIAVDEIDNDEPPMDIDDEDQKSNASGESPEKIEQKKDNIIHILRLPFAIQAEKRNLAAFKQKIYTEVDVPNLRCKKCDTKHSSVLELYEHMADHFNWMRYACKLCNFRHYSFEKLPEHVKVVHKLKGDSDFYHSTVKAIDGTEAMIISSCLAEPESAEETNDAPERSPESRRPSRCSSDSSRLSDDSSSSNTLKEPGNRKRKMYQNKSTSKKRKETVKDNGDNQPDEDVNIDDGGNSNNSPSLKAFEENSSDLDEIEDKLARHRNSEDNKPVASRRPVRKRTKPKNEDFEYDLSNLLKMEAQGYRESQAVTTTKTYQEKTKKKVQSESPTSNDTNINKDHCGALMTLSKKAIETASAHMKTWLYASAKDQKANVFARPMLPRVFARSDKSSPKKDIDDPKDAASPSKVSKASEKLDPIKNEEKDNLNKSCKEENKSVAKNEVKSTNAKPNKSLVEKAINTIIGNTDPLEPTDTSDTLNQNGSHETPVEKVKVSANSTPAAVVPIKFRRQSLDLIKNPLINKNINDFSKAGMKTKILVIKPINRNKDGTRAVNSPLKFQTIKLKDPSNGSSSSSDDKKLDQVMVVKVPKVSRAAVGEIQAAATSAASSNANSQTHVDKKTDEIETRETDPKQTTEAEVKSDNNLKQSAPNEAITENVAPEIVKETESPKIVEAPA